MRTTRRRIAVVLICVASAFTCEIAFAEPLYRFGVPPWQRGQSVEDIRRLYKPLLDYLWRATDAKITIVTARSYEDMVHYFADGGVDFGTISPMPYGSAQRLNPGVKLLLTELGWDPTHTKRVDSYQGMIVTLRAREDINTVDDLRGKRMGFVSEQSTSGFVFPSAYLQSIGIDYKNRFPHLRLSREPSEGHGRPRHGQRRCRCHMGLQPQPGCSETRGCLQGHLSDRHPQSLDRNFTLHSQAQSVRRSKRPCSMSTTRSSRVAAGRLRRVAGELLRRDTQDRSQSVELSERQWRASACGPGYDLVGRAGRRRSGRRFVSSCSFR